MIRSSVTACLVPEARRGPFVFHGDLAAACATAARLGFDGIEVFAPSGDYVDAGQMQELLDLHGLRMAAVGTGAGMILHNLSLSDSNTVRRERACEFVRRVVDFGAPFGAPAIVGSMQGSAGNDQARESALGNLADSLRQLGEHAASQGQILLFEPLNRYETDLVNTVSDGVDLCRRADSSNLKLMADLFHMNIEEADIAQSIADHAGHIGHVHFADSNRRAVGFGHTPMQPVMQALSEAGYNGFASAEVFPDPDSLAAAEMTIRSFRRYVSD